MISDSDFDFEHWRKLAEEDPARYFAERRLLIERFIAEAPPRLEAELRQLQGLIDGSRAEAGTPVAALQRMMGMLGDYLGALSGQMQGLQEQSRELASLLATRRD